MREALPLIRQDKAAFLINCGDHKAVYERLKQTLDEIGIPAVIHSDWAETVAFADAMNDPAQSVRGVHLFLHEDVFCAVYATNILMRGADFLLTKPSELAYYPIPKIFLQRVGGHEAWGAIRGSELGDGCIECPTTADAVRMQDLCVTQEEPLRLFCESIMMLAEDGVYNGAYRVIDLALARRGAR